MIEPYEDNVASAHPISPHDSSTDSGIVSTPSPALSVWQRCVQGCFQGDEVLPPLPSALSSFLPSFLFPPSSMVNSAASAPRIQSASRTHCCLKDQEQRGGEGGAAPPPSPRSHKSANKRTRREGACSNKDHVKVLLDVINYHSAPGCVGAGGGLAHVLHEVVTGRSVAKPPCARGCLVAEVRQSGNEDGERVECISLRARTYLIYTCRRRLLRYDLSKILLGYVTSQRSCFDLERFNSTA